MVLVRVRIRARVGFRIRVRVRIMVRVELSSIQLTWSSLALVSKIEQGLAPKHPFLACCAPKFMTRRAKGVCVCEALVILAYEDNIH